MRRAISASELSSDSKQLDHEIKLLHKQIALAEKSFACLIKDFTNISIDISRLQSRQNELVSSLSIIANEESPSLQKCLNAITEHIENIVASSSAHSTVIEESILHSISEHVVECKQTRQNVEAGTTATKKRAATLKTLEKSQNRLSKLPNKKPSKAEIQAQNEALEIRKQIHELERSVKEFEKLKVENIRTWLKTYLHSSLAYHIKAVEELTKAYQALSLIDVDDHLQYFDAKLYPDESSSRVNFVRWNSFNSLTGKE